MKWLLLAGFVLGIGACHIISGGDEIVVAPEDDEGSGTDSGSGSNTTVGGSTSSGSTCSSDWDCDEFGCWCTTSFEIDGIPCTDPQYDPQFNCEQECHFCE